MIDVVYDGGCRFCLSVLRQFRRLDVAGRLRFLDGREVGLVTGKIPALEGADFGAAMYVYVAGEAPYRGFFAVRRMLWASPLTWLMLPLFYAPFANVVGPRIYAWVARNRRGLGCRSDVCTRPTPLTPPQER